MKADLGDGQVKTDREGDAIGEQTKHRIKL